MGCFKCDHIKWLIIFTCDTLSGFHCNYILYSFYSASKIKTVTVHVVTITIQWFEKVRSKSYEKQSCYRFRISDIEEPTDVSQQGNTNNWHKFARKNIVLINLFNYGHPLKTKFKQMW